MKEFRMVLVLVFVIALTNVGICGRAGDASTTNVPVVFSGGYDTDPRDHGRPVILIASALGVPAEVFREAFSHVHPAPAREEPEPGQVHDNKEALLSALAPYGVENDRLDEVSNYYRYDHSRGEMWRNTPAAAYAIISNGTVQRYVVTNGGSGYTTPPKATLPSLPNARAEVKLSFGKEFQKNGSVSSIVPE